MSFPKSRCCSNVFKCAVVRSTMTPFPTGLKRAHVYVGSFWWAQFMVGCLQFLAPDYMVVREGGHHTPRLPPSWLLSRRTWRRLTAELSWLSLYHPPPSMGICTPLLSGVDSLHHKSLLLFFVFIKRKEASNRTFLGKTQNFPSLTCSSMCRELSLL